MNNEVSQSKLESQTGGGQGAGVEFQGAESRLSWCWKMTKSQENKVLRFVAFGLIISLLILIIGYNLKPSLYNDSITDTFRGSLNSNKENKICLTKGCVIAAANVIDRLDLSVDPCDDFYSFACGNFVKKVVLPEDKSFVTSISTTNDILSLKLRMLVEEELRDTDPPSTKLVKNLYRSCMNTDLIQQNGVKPLERILKALGGWPVVEGDRWDEEKLSLIDLIFSIRKFAFSETPFFVFGVVRDYRNSSWRIIEFDQAKLGMPSREYLMKGLNDSDVQAYLDYQIRLATLFGADPKRAKEELEETVKFEIQLANFSLPEELRRDINFRYNKMTIRELSENVPDFPWLNFTNYLIPPNAEPISEDEFVLVGNPPYLMNLFNLIKVTPKRVLFNYLMRHVVMVSVQYLSKEIRDAELQYSKKIFGFNKEAPRWKECMDKASDELTYAVGSLYVRHFFNEEAKAQAEEMVRYIRKAIDRNLENIDWMDEKTRKRALKKAQAIRALIGYPKEILDEDILMDHYKNLTISEGDFFSNIANISFFKRNLMLGRLREKVVEADWKIYGSAAVVNAFYSSVDNAIIFPAGILQGVFFDANRPKYMNYGSIGLVIGHEITHGFDDEGSQFNENGDLKNWWDDETKLKFLNRSKCIIEQYANFFVPEVQLYLNGIRTQGENIADNGGIKEAYRAYNMWIKDIKEEELSLPGLEYTPRQLFWVSAAHLWCSKLRNEHLKVSVLSKFHSPPSFRVNGPMKNLEEFSRDWNCPANSNMNPPKKCRVW